MHIKCDCGNNTFKINWWPPMNAEAICTECGEKHGIGGTETTEEIDQEENHNSSFEDLVLETLIDLGANDQAVSYKELIEELEAENESVENAINNLLSRGSLYEPTPGKIRVL